ncbi:LacI family DNA-binding transcriptional regulator [Arthrobacter sp. StoSoilB5]|uniref:LacI family DNA-binding transcriptional regulator n=1 Tax=Arthrobacter sp. StoSoilB5 TaxID=2830992 RepID=UPI001CC6942B|nr:LacI family DNA-binding transcriptional regulator [Arthrobacter sp. StoSoilB5]BCW45142.1 LacI family transcriptional regulator [Arthrobacter sp. StoSoilB5]
MPSDETIIQSRTAKATIYDVARQAGVNPSTVSRALNNPERVNSQTRSLIEATAVELNFQLNHAAKVLQTGSTKTLGLIVSDVTNPTFFGILREAGKAAAQRDYTVVFVNAAESATTELASANRVISAVDGLILTSPRMNESDIQTLARTTQIVVINREVSGISCVIPDPDRGVSQAVRFLAGIGHKKVLFVAGPEQSWMSARRWNAISAACEWCHLTAERIESAAPTVDGGRRVARTVKASGATAVITHNDLLAIGLMHELQVAGVAIPEALSIIGFDDIFGADFTTPSLTSIRSPLGQCGSLSAGLILDSLSGSVKDPQTLLVDTELVIRGSAGPWKGV